MRTGLFFSFYGICGEPYKHGHPSMTDALQPAILIVRRV